MSSPPNIQSNALEIILELKTIRGKYVDVFLSLCSNDLNYALSLNSFEQIQKNNLLDLKV